MEKRQVYVWREAKGVIPREEAYQHDYETGAGPTVIRDTIDPLWCPLDGKMHTSKSSIRRVAKEMGAIEVGTEKLKDTRQPLRRTTRDDIDRAISMLKQGYRPPVRYENDF